MRGPTLSRLMRLLLVLLVSNLWFLAGCNSQETQQLNIGDPAPNFTAETEAGHSISLSDYTNKQPVLLFFHMAGG